MHLLQFIFPASLVTKGAHSHVWAGPQLGFTGRKLPNLWSFQHRQSSGRASGALL